MVENIEFLGHVTFKIKGSKLIYTDPYQIGQDEPADIILISHSHYDHFSPDDIKKVLGKETTIVSCSDCAVQAKNLAEHVIGLLPGQEVNVQGVSISAVPAYNIGKSFHPKSNNWNGYVFQMDGTRYYFPGDTDRIPEMAGIETDIVFLPVGGTYTMDYKEAAAAVTDINPKTAIPMHYGSVAGSVKDAQKFVKLVGDKGLLLQEK
jgi:L-ascorbate metabolism protein UlaG (beta-lactamase superfamily)